MKTKNAWMGLMIATLLAAACTPAPVVIPVTGASTPSSQEVLAEQEATIFTLETRLAITPSALPPATLTPTATVTQTPVDTFTPTLTLSPSRTLSSTPLPSVTPTLAPTSIYAANDCNLAEFVADLNIPDGTVINAGTTFVKSWRLRNIGSCPWTPDYRIVSVGDLPLGGPAYSRLGISINPGQTIDLSLALVAPTTAGEYTNNYRLEDPNGNRFGVGAGGGEPIDAHIVDSALPPLAVTHVDLSVNNSVVTANCPPGFPFIFSADIVSSAPGNITYHWIFSDGTRTAAQTLNYTAAGTQTVSAVWLLGANGKLPSNPFSGTASLYIDDPNHQSFGAQPVGIGCIFPTPTP